VPADYRIDRQRRVVLSRAWGVLCDDDLLGRQERLRDDPDFRPDLNEVFDFRAVTRVEVTTRGVQLLADRNPFGAGSRRAFVVEQPVMYGVSRMFQAMTDRHPDELRVQFDAMDDARKWCGLEPETPPEGGDGAS